MNALWQKDKLILKKYSWLVATFWLLVYPLFFSFQTNLGLLVAPQIIIGFMVFGISALQADGINRGYEQLFALPITRKDYVAEKFLLFGGICSGALLFNSLFAVIFYSIKGTISQQSSELLIGEFGVTILLLLIFGCLLSKTIPQGQVKISYLTFCFFVIPLLILASGLFLAQIGVNFMSIRDLLFAIHPLVILLLGILLCSVIWWLFYLLTLRSFNQIDIPKAAKF